MKMLILLVGVLLLFGAMHFHALTKVNVITKIDRTWFKRMLCGDRVPKDNLTDVGLHYRKLSNLCAIGGLLIIVASFFLFA